MNISISYVIATRNRLDFLKITIPKLIAAVEPDEEIIVVDGNSTDGTKEYLQQLFEEGKIHQFVSEPDHNQAHAWNKAMLMARGTIIKKIIDDDVFCYSAIRKCRNFMLQNHAIDVVISNDLASSLDSFQQVSRASRQPQFDDWKSGKIPSFTFGDVHMLVRRSSLALIGLYNTEFVMMDWEYSLRISHLQANIAYFTGYNALSVAHPETVSSNKNIALIKRQGEHGAAFYHYAGDLADISLWSKMKIIGGKFLKPAKKEASEKQPAHSLENMSDKYNFYYNYLIGLNESENFKFLLKD